MGLEHVVLVNSLLSLLCIPVQPAENLPLAAKEKELRHKADTLTKVVDLHVRGVCLSLH